MKRCSILLMLTFFMSLISSSAWAAGMNGKPVIERMDPPHWFAGMEDTSFQLMVYGDQLGDCIVKVNGCARLDSVVRPSNKHYLFLYVNTQGCSSSTLGLTFVNGRRTTKVDYQLRARSEDKQRFDALNTADFMYLLMPDRFANGDYSNDVVAGMNEIKLNRDWMYDRHGGDLQGVIDHLDYLEDLGVTALWLNPVLENDEPKTSYHGYAATDSYRIDPRFGSNQKYVELGDELQKRGMKLVKDVIYNHWGDQHHLILDPPDDDWVHAWPEFTRTNHRPYPYWDPYASDYDKKVFAEGWFDHHMPDINQRSPLLADYLIQNTLWWIETAGLDALRIDTYYYPDQEFMADLGARVALEYPNCFVFGECWIKDPIALNWVMDDAGYRDIKASALKSVTDFPLYFATLDALTKDPGWESGPMQWYLTLTADALLDDRPDHVVFLDNHDLSRYYSMIGEDYERFEIGLAFLMTTRGIPMIYYGTEILMANYCDPDGKVRSDFPGGWAEDPENKFTVSGRNEAETKAHAFVSHLAKWRKENAWLGDSDLLHFVPQQDVYVYFRLDPESGKTVMVALNPQTKSVTLDLERYREVLPEQVFVKNVMTGKDSSLSGSVHLAAKSFLILELIK